MKINKITGYIAAILGLLILCFNAYLYFTVKKIDRGLTGLGILICLIGAFMIRASKSH
jgi:hypothetical protein